jgi:predicted CopG family antitoxin
MKTLNIPLEDKEYEELNEKKGSMNWHDFILRSIIKERMNALFHQILVEFEPAINELANVKKPKKNLPKPEEVNL